MRTDRSNWNTLFILVRRDVLKTWRESADLLYPIMFFVLVTILFPFALSPETLVLRSFAGGLLWIAALLAMSVSLENLFKTDYSSGALEAIVLSGVPLLLVGLAKAIANWVLSGLPIIILAIPLALSLGIDTFSLSILLLSLTLGSATISLIGTSIGALSVGLRSAGMLIIVLALPFFIPILIFGAVATSNSQTGVIPEAELYFLAGLLVLAVTLTPWATASAIRTRLS